MADAGDRLLSAWVGLTGGVGPLVRGIVALRRRRGKEHPARWRERLGHASAGPRPGSATVWVHAASVGETVAILPLVKRLAENGLSVVLTTVTITSAAVVENRLPTGAVHQFAPVDTAPAIDRFLDAWRPRLAVFVESELWPVTLQRLAARGIPLVVSNGRMSERSFRGWSRVPSVARAVFGRIGLCLAQSDADAERFAALGAGRVATAGNIKFDAPVPEAARPVAAALAAATAKRPVWLAASTHPGEDEVVIDAFERLAARVPDLLLVLAPRHPERGTEVTALAAGRGLPVCQRSAGALPGRGTAVYVADTVGELGTFYKLATVAFVGGSLVDQGGHNPIEPGRLGAAVVTGPNVRNFEEVYGALFADGAATVVGDAVELADAVEHLVRHTVARERQVAAAEAVVERYTGALERTWQALQPFLAAVVSSSRPEDGA
jgi:3-deoxy-D-manno-octulosonic-acid transferase